MPYTKEQLRTYWATNKAVLNQRRKDKRRLAKLGLAISEEVSHSSEQVSHLKVSRFSPGEVSHGEVSNQVKRVSHNLTEQVSQISPEKISQLTTNPHLTKLIQAWQTQTNYACPPTCSHSYCANCWYFADQELIDYKTHSPPK